MSLAAVILPAILPALLDGVRGVFAKFTKGAGGTPVNVNERVQLMQAENERLRALAEIDRPADDISLWVKNLRASFRYIVIFAVWATTAIAVFTPEVPESLTLNLLDLSGATMMFIIGERFYFKPK
jgi:hypothetical protein